MIQATLTLKVTITQVVETSFTVNNSPIQDYTHPEDHTPPIYTIKRGQDLGRQFHTNHLYFINSSLELVPLIQFTAMRNLSIKT